MATYTTLKYGSKGDEVKKLQTSLGFTGKDVDGIFGDKTLSAVKDYQKNNGLTVDGIVGKNTWGSLNKASTTAPSNTTTPSPTQTNNSFEYKDFEYADPKDSDIVKQAESMLQQHMANKPGQTQSAWTDTLNETLNKILNKEKFSYDLNGDALYQQYKDQYTTQGQMAMMDTMGQAQAMTGGYGNSYAQSVGQQTYQGYLQQLNDKVPELYQIALNQYNQEKEDLYNQASLASAMEQKDYDRGRDAVSDYYTELQYLTNNVDKLYDREVAERDFAAGLWADKQKYGFDIHQSDKSDANTMAMTMLGMGLMPDAETLAMAGISSAEASAIVNKVNEQSGSNDTSGVNVKTNGFLGIGPEGGSGYDNKGYSDSVVKQAQKFVGASADGKWGDDSTAKAMAKGYNSINEVVAAMGGEIEALPGDNPFIDSSKYADWDAGDWESYFAQIRQSEGQAAAEEELKYFTSNGLIPTKFVSYGAIGARGGQMGH